MRNPLLSLICGLLLAAPALHSSVAHAQDAAPAPAATPELKLLNPHAELLKSIKPTERQKNLLDNVDASVGLKVQETFTTLAAYVGTLRVKTALLPKYMARVAEAEKLSAEEMIAAKKAIWADVHEEIRPTVEKETLKQVRATMLSYFKEAEPVVTAAQKPALKETRGRVEKNFDKELPVLCKLVAEKLLTGNN